MNFLRRLFGRTRPREARGQDAAPVDPPSDEDFKAIESNSDSENRCSPGIPHRGWYGIKIAGPKHIHFQASIQQDYADKDYIVHPEPKVIVAGVFEYECKRLDAGRCSRAHETALVITDTATARSWSMSLRALKRQYVAHVLGMNVSYSDPPPSAKKPRRSKVVSIGGHFNADIGLCLTSPKEPTLYRIHAEFGPYRSNAIAILVHP